MCSMTCLKAKSMLAHWHNLSKHTHQIPVIYQGNFDSFWTDSTRGIASFSRGSCLCTRPTKSPCAILKHLWKGKLRIHPWDEPLPPSEQRCAASSWNSESDLLSMISSAEYLSTWNSLTIQYFSWFLPWVLAKALPLLHSQNCSIFSNLLQKLLKICWVRQFRNTLQALNH